MKKRKIDPIEVVVTRTKSGGISRVLETFLVRYKKHTNSDWALSKEKRKEILVRIRVFERDNHIDIDQHIEMVNYIFDNFEMFNKRFNYEFHIPIGAIVSNWFYNIWRAKPSKNKFSRSPKFVKSSKEEFEKEAAKRRIASKCRNRDLREGIQKLIDRGLAK